MPVVRLYAGRALFSRRPSPPPTEPERSLLPLDLLWHVLMFAQSGGELRPNSQPSTPRVQSSHPSCSLSCCSLTVLALVPLLETRLSCAPGDRSSPEAYLASQRAIVDASLFLRALRRP